MQIRDRETFSTHEHYQMPQAVNVIYIVIFVNSFEEFVSRKQKLERPPAFYGNDITRLLSFWQKRAQTTCAQAFTGT